MTKLTEDNAKNVVTFLIILLLGIVSIGCVHSASAQSAVYVITTSEGGEFDFIGDGDEWDWYIDVTGYDVANVDLTNHWIYSTDTVIYNNIGDGEIHVKVSNRNYQNEWMYYDWDIVQYDGNGLHEPILLNGGGRSVNVTNSPNVTTYIEQVTNIRKAVFLMDTRHSSADLTVCVHNGHLLENASVELIGGPRAVQWTDEIGEAEFKPSTGKYAMVIEAEGFDTMLVEDLHFESQNSYYIRVNMTDCLSSCGSPFCAPDTDDLVMYYKQKEPNMGVVSPQGYVDYFAERLTTCMAGQDPCAVGTLERMCTRWGIYPQDLGVLLYNCTFTNTEIVDDTHTYNIEYTIGNFQQYKSEYIVTLVCGGTNGITTLIGSGVLDETWSTSGKLTDNVEVKVKNGSDQMYLMVTSEQVED